uniref:hypothetical protein n=1 Tax=Agathobacter sp. TaxID=2021311 RepID=UPI004056F131
MEYLVNDKKEAYLEEFKKEYGYLMERFEGDKNDKKEQIHYLIEMMGYGKLELDYKPWLEECLQAEDWPNLCKLIQQNNIHELVPCAYGGYTYEANLEIALNAFACGDTTIITTSLPYGGEPITDCYRPFFLVALHLLTALWHQDEAQMQTALLAGKKFLARKASLLWERGVVSFLMDLHARDMEKASVDLQNVCKSYFRLQSPMLPLMPLCVNAHGLYCLAQMLLPEGDFAKLKMPEYKNFSKKFALWRKENTNPDLAPYFEYPGEFELINYIYRTPPTKLVFEQFNLDNPNLPPKKRKEWFMYALKMQKNLIDEVWKTYQGSFQKC